MAAKAHCARVAELLGPRRYAELMRPRRAAIVALRRSGLSWYSIARRMQRDHVSVIRQARRGEAIAARDAEFAALVDRMVAAVVVPAAETQIES